MSSAAVTSAARSGRRAGAADRAGAAGAATMRRRRSPSLRGGAARRARRGRSRSPADQPRLDEQPKQPAHVRPCGAEERPSPRHSRACSLRCAWTAAQALPASAEVAAGRPPSRSSSRDVDQALLLQPAQRDEDGRLGDRPAGALLERQDQRHAVGLAAARAAWPGGPAVRSAGASVSPWRRRQPITNSVSRHARAVRP